MAADFEAVENMVKSYVADVKKIFPIEKAYIYGSYAKGSATEHSDVDICFFSDCFNNRKSVDVICDLLFIARKYPEYDIEPRAFPMSEITRGNPFVKEVLRTGYEVIV